MMKQGESSMILQPPEAEAGSVFNDDDDISMALESIRDDLGGDSERKKPKEPHIAREESRAVFYVRLLVFVLLLGVTAGVALGVFYYVSNAETEDFEEDFHDSSDKVFDSVGSTLDQSLGAIDNLMVSIVSHQEFSNSSWPNVTVPNFAVKAAKILTLSKASVIGLYPRVTHDQRPAWEEYAKSHDYWVNQSLAVQRADENFGGTNLDSWQAVSQIHSYNGPLPPQEKYYPTWQASPVVPRFGAYNWDLYPPFSNELDEMETHRAVTMGRTLNLPREGNEAEQLEQQSTINWISDLISDKLDPTEPLFPFYYPVVLKATDGVDVATKNPEDHPVVGVIAMTLFWREIVKNILSPGSEGVVAVFGSDCNQTLTYQINGPNVVFLGEGNKHSSKYTKYERRAYLHELGEYALRGNQEIYTGYPLSSQYCPYWMRLYPSDTMAAKHETSNPLIFTFVAISIFVFTSVVFLVYDCVSEHRQKKVLQVAVQSTAVVSNLFPQVVRDRIFPTGSESHKPKPKERIETAKLRLQQFLRSDDEALVSSESGADEDGGSPGNAPIAELFSETTVMFCDIAGFTAWSSVREPAQVFTLLETLYGAYDRLASRRGVFKVETIGDSYVAVAGLPEPRADHAVVMGKFARDVREKTADLVRRLGRTLGPDTGDLEVRIGLNSGPVTAGVLRGERSRFQLFGDTVNTAARMESTGMVSKIQISESTATLLKKAGKAHWVAKREGEVEAKGKGRIQTYWCEPTQRQASSTSADETVDEADFQVMDEKTRRLVEWNVEIMVKLLKQVVSRREARESLAARNRNRASAKPVETPATPNELHLSMRLGTVLDEVKEVIMLPEFDPVLAHNPRSPETIELSTAVMTQLREYISLIASMYRNNPFHSFEHASHVTMSVVKLLSRIVAPSDRVIRTAQESEGPLASTLHDHTYGITSDPLTQFACVFSALIHDVDHPGVPNSQLIVENSPLVNTYKGKSMAEQNSVDISWRLLMEDQFEDLRTIICANKSEMGRFRQLVVNGVMATDIMDKDLKNLRNQRWDKAFQEGSRLGETMAVNTNRKATIVIEHLIQASDVAHTMQHWHIFRKWNERLFTEMYVAYKAGRAEKNPADFWYKGEMGFFDFYIIPLAKKLSDCGVFGVSSDEYLSYATKNREEWEHRGQEVVAAMVAKFEVPEEVLGSEEKERTNQRARQDSDGPETESESNMSGSNSTSARLNAPPSSVDLISGEAEG